MHVTMRHVTSARRDLDRRISPPLGAKALYVLQRRRCRVLRCVGILDRAFHPSAAHERGANQNLIRVFRKPDGAPLVISKGTMPSGGIHVPRANINAAAHHNGPDRNETMIVSCADPDVLTCPERGQDIVSESSHLKRCYTSSAEPRAASVARITRVRQTFPAAVNRGIVAGKGEPTTESWR